MICYHIDQGQQSLKVMTPDFECFKYCKPFFVMEIIVELGWGKSPRVEGDWMNFTVSWRYGGKDGSQGVVWGICFNNKRGAWNPVGQDWHVGCILYMPLIRSIQIFSNFTLILWTFSTIHLCIHSFATSMNFIWFSMILFHLLLSTIITSNWGSTFYFDSIWRRIC